MARTVRPDLLFKPFLNTPALNLAAGLLWAGDFTLSGTGVVPGQFRAVSFFGQRAPLRTSGLSGFLCLCRRLPALDGVPRQL